MVGIDFSTSLREVRTELVGHVIYFRCAGSNDTTWYIISCELEELRGEMGVPHQYPILFVYIYIMSIIWIERCWVFVEMSVSRILIPKNWLKKCHLCKLSLRGSKARENLDELFCQNIYIVQSMCDQSHQLPVLPNNHSIIGCWRHGGGGRRGLLLGIKVNICLFWTNIKHVAKEAYNFNCW